VPRATVGRRGIVASSIALSLSLAAVAPAAEAPWHVARGEVRVVVPLKPGGAFEATSTALSGSLTPGAGKPVPLTGELVLELSTIDTGIDLRNRHLRDKYLELGKGRGFDKAALSEIVVADAAGTDFQGRSGFTGTLLLHGVRKPVSGTAEFKRAGTATQVEASFPLTLTDFSIMPPEYLGVGVADRVMVKVKLTVAPARAAGP
jgi:polyisoprenoid-binding protein YceI